MSIEDSPTPVSKPDWLPSNPTTLKLFQINARSIVNKINQIQNFVYSNKVDILGVTETWLTDMIYDLEIFPSSYTIYRKDRNSRGGGVMIAVRDKIHSELITTNSDLEILTVKIGIHFPLILRIVYMPPYSSFD